MRQSNFELLRIVSIILIMLMHIVAVAALTDNTFNKMLLLFINTIGNTGVTIFILISGYFGIQFTIKKLYIIWSIVWFYSICTYIIQLTIYNYTFNISDFITAIFPVFRYKYWFMTCYIILFCLSPFLNKIITALSKSNFQKLLLILCLFFIICPTLYFTEILNDHGKGIINMTIVYLIGQYIRKYNIPNILIKHNILILSSCLFIIFTLNALVTFYKGYFYLKFAHDNSLFIVISSIIIFLIFKNINISSNIINKIAQYTFPLYLLQELLSRSLHSWCLPYINEETLIFHIIIVALYIGGLTIIIEKSRQILFNKFNERIANNIERIYIIHNN